MKNPLLFRSKIRLLRIQINSMLHDGIAKDKFKDDYYMNQLNELNLFLYKAVDYSDEGLKTSGIELTDEGKHYLQGSFETFIRNVFTSLVTPIVVSVITTLITLWLFGKK